MSKSVIRFKLGLGIGKDELNDELLMVSFPLKFEGIMPLIGTIHC